MQLEALRLVNFRNYSEQEVAPGSRLNLLLGQNAQGKSNLLEAVYLLATGRSYRGAADAEMVRWGAAGFAVRGRVQRAYGEVLLEVAYQVDQRKRVRVNGTDVRRLSELFGYLTAVIFSPEDLQLVKGGPAHRRRFLDLELAQIDPAYRQDLIDYQQVLVQRNNLLREGGAVSAASASRRLGPRLDLGQLEVWDEQLVTLGARLHAKRARAVRALSRLAAEAHRRITAGRETLRLAYLAAAGPGGRRVEAEGEGAESTPEAFRRRLAEELERVRPLEARRGMTLLGPHRDDLLLAIDGAEARSFASQGQQRTAALALKLGELEFMREETGEYPLLLLDDVMSELDSGRRRFLLEAAGERAQVFVTATSRRALPAGQEERAQVFTVEQGKIAPGGEPLSEAGTV
ncbi:MAG: DNA replication/repair protein RecF [Bacillota bacterium]|nr:DNA replication/repair protein RecF [Bacillota bacterium]